MTEAKTTNKRADADEFRKDLEAAAAKPAPRERTTEQDRAGALRSREADDTSYWDRAGKDQWSPGSQLQLPDNDPEYVYRWIAEYVNGSLMSNRLTKARREDWLFVRIDELPEGFIVDEDTKGDGLARVGGLVMAKLPRKFAVARRKYYARRSAEALDGANELQGVAGRNAVKEDRGTRTLDGPAAGDALRSMAR